MEASSPPTTHRFPAAGPALGLALVAALLAAVSSIDPRWHAALDYRRDAVAAGELWRLVTAHVMHLSIEHAVLDIAALLLVAWIFSEELDGRLQASAGAVGLAMIDATLWVAQVDRYVGLSGVLHAWFATGATCWLLAARSDPARASKRAWGAALTIGLAAKLVLEQQHRAFWLGGASFEVVTSAHRAGAMAGVCCGVAAAWFRRRTLTADAGYASRRR